MTERRSQSLIMVVGFNGYLNICLWIRRGGVDGHKGRALCVFAWLTDRSRGAGRQRSLHWTRTIPGNIWSLSNLPFLAYGERRVRMIKTTTFRINLRFSFIITFLVEGESIPSSIQWMWGKWKYDQFRYTPGQKLAGFYPKVLVNIDKLSSPKYWIGSSRNLIHIWTDLSNSRVGRMQGCHFGE